MAAVNQKVNSGNLFIVLVDGKPVGLAQSVDMQDDYGLEAASGIGDIHTIENVPTQARHAVSVEEMSLRKANLRQLGIIPENGDGALKGIVFDIVAQRRDDGTVSRKYVGCSYASGSVHLRKHSIVVSSAQFHALDVQGTDI